MYLDFFMYVCILFILYIHLFYFKLNIQINKNLFLKTVN